MKKFFEEEIKELYKIQDENREILRPLDEQIFALQTQKMNLEKQLDHKLDEVRDHIGEKIKEYIRQTYGEDPNLEDLELRQLKKWLTSNHLVDVGDGVIRTLKRFNIQYCYVRDPKNPKPANKWETTHIYTSI